MEEFQMRTLASFPLTFFFISAVFLGLPGCKIEIRVPQGGTVQSSDGAYICEAGQTCVIDVVDLFFDETFIAVPAPGYTFSRWKDKDRYLCGGETAPCRLFTADFEGKPALESIMESDETFFLEPRFIWSPYCPDEGIVLSPSFGRAD